jgi:hypothetical protein
MRLTLIGVVTAAMMVLSTTASAQTPNPTIGRKVWVTMADASVHHGTVVLVTSDAVMLKVGGATLALPTQDVRRIEAPDRVSDGVAKGAIGMAVVGGVGTGLLSAAFCESNCGSYVATVGLVGAAMGGAAGALIGGLLDAGNPARKVIFERTSLTIAPVITGRSRSVSFVVRW